MSRPPVGVSAELWEIIERVCTPREIEVLRLKGAGLGRYRIANVLGVAESSVRDRLRRAERKIRAEVAAMRGVTDAP